MLVGGVGAHSLVLQQLTQMEREDGMGKSGGEGEEYTGRGGRKEDRGEGREGHGHV